MFVVVVIIEVFKLYIILKKVITTTTHEETKCVEANVYNCALFVGFFQNRSQLQSVKCTRCTSEYINTTALATMSSRLFVTAVATADISCYARYIAAL